LRVWKSPYAFQEDRKILHGGLLNVVTQEYAVATPGDLFRRNVDLNVMMFNNRIAYKKFQEDLTYEF